MPIRNYISALERTIKRAPLDAASMAQGMGTAQSEGAARFGSNFLPGIGDAAGLMQDAEMFYRDPSSRTPGNALLSAIGALPMVPPMAAIIAPSKAKSLKTLLNMPTHPEFQAAVANTPGASITKDGLLMRIARRQKPDVEGEQAVRTGVFYLPDGDKRMSFYGGKSGYGGSEKFSGETIFANPLFVRGATGGKAPENAYNAIKGKGAYEAMRRDVLDSIPYGQVTYKERADRIRDVLKKYGGDPDMADLLLETGKEGNTLPYAIQEHIVAHAVRSAGHDGVIGYSKGKQGPFISEVFDTRELTYPSDVLEPQIHDAYEN